MMTTNTVTGLSTSDCRVLTHIGEEEEDSRCQGDNLSYHPQVVRGCCIRIWRLGGRKMIMYDIDLIQNIEKPKYSTLIETNIRLKD